MERSIQVLKKDVDWKYSAPVILRGHWIEEEHDEEYADHMEEFLGGIKDDVGLIRNGREDCCTCLNNEDGPAILHDNARLLPR